MNPRPWMPLYVADYLGDTVDLSADEHGCYLVLLMLTWRRPDAALPDDMPWLKRSLSACMKDMHGNRFNSIVPGLLNRFFSQGKDGKFRNKRLTSERKTARKLSAIQKEKAKKRWAKNSKTNGLNDAAADAEAMPSHSQSHSQSQEKINKAPERSSKPSRKKPKTTLPDSFTLTAERSATAQRHGIAHHRIASVFEHFRNHHLAKGNAFANWDAAWVTWCTRDREFNHQPNGTANGKPSVSTAVDDLIARASAAEEPGTTNWHGDVRPENRR